LIAQERFAHAWMPHAPQNSLVFMKTCNFGDGNTIVDVIRNRVMEGNFQNRDLASLATIRLVLSRADGLESQKRGRGAEILRYMDLP
jgi:hypothetical protein